MLNLQIVQAKARPNNVADGIECAHFVEMDLLNCAAVNFCFRFRQPAEYSLCVRLHTIVQGRAIDHLINMREMPVSFLLAAVHFEFRRGNATPLRFLYSNGTASIELFQSSF